MAHGTDHHTVKSRTDRSAPGALRFGVCALVLALLSGCGGGGGGDSGSGSIAGNAGAGTGSSTGGSTPAPAAFEVVRAEPTHGTQPTAPTLVRLVFSRSVLASSVVMDPANAAGSTLLVVEQAAGASTGAMRAGAVAVTGAEVVFTPAAPFTAGNTYYVALTSGVTDPAGAALATGSVSGPRSLVLPDLVFQASFVPAAATGGGSGTGSSTGGSGGSGAGTPTPTATPASLISGYALEAGTDPWYIDFTTAATFPQDLRSRGLGSGDATVDLWARNRVIRRIMGYTSVRYRRNEDGTGVSGSSWQISFTTTQPSGRAGVDYSRHCIGGAGGNTLGESWYDPRNRDREDNSPASQTGVYSTSIDGQRSTLTTAIRTSELRYVDGTYVLGQGTAAEDARFRAIQDALLDYGTAIGCVLAHEVGHSVGLDHDRDGNTSIMSASLSEAMLSNVNMQFGQTSRTLLNRDLGIRP